MSPVPPIAVIEKRRDFLLASNSGLKFVKPSVVIQTYHRHETKSAFLIPPETIRVGFTATKKLGNAVIRNRAKRRMRHAVFPLLETLGVAGYDYVLIAREACYKGSYVHLNRDIRHALRWLRDRINEQNAEIEK